MLTGAGFHVLLALAKGPAHGYAVMRFVEQVSDGAVRLGPGTLYRTISRLLADGLVEETDEDDPGAPHDARRRYYRLTGPGEQTLRSEVALLTRMVEAAREAGVT
ncbi:PadR family transcriptional regulator [Nonomuraea sp. NPDC050663]|uniref:DNA-binding PadR family transcriptional regulator n=1 Tax=Nonomuraea soli TaxID=1032476 RepID=A0A7W0HRD0_9ACTN|nr:PadR family transcriptional regulator [Nonomuraea soli]MBA2892810.1 DNA-binding PadR family transcriptional regulator [Nonomuraea soli]